MIYSDDKDEDEYMHLCRLIGAFTVYQYSSVSSDSV